MADSLSLGVPQPLSGSPTLAVMAVGVGKRFRGRWALAHLNLEVREGTALLLTGHNGSGKTTLLRILATACAPSTGEVRILGMSASSASEGIRAAVGFLAHDNFLYADLTGEENLQLLARLVDASSARVRAALERVGLASRAQSPVREYSAGMRKRLAIARLLLKAPRLALLDEPFGELDPAGIAEVEGIVAELRRAGTTIILTTHLVAQGLRLTDQRLHLDGGRAVPPPLEST